MAWEESGLQSGSSALSCFITYFGHVMRKVVHTATCSGHALGHLPSSLGGSSHRPSRAQEVGACFSVPVPELQEAEIPICQLQSWILYGSCPGGEIPQPPHPPTCFVPKKAEVLRSGGKEAPMGPLVVRTGIGQALAQ